MTKAKPKAEAKAKAKTKAMTPKQMAIKANSLLKGIDNSVAAIQKHRTSIVQNAGELAGLLSGLSNAASTPVKAAPVKKATAPVKKAEKAPAKKAEKKTPAKAKAKAKATKAGASQAKPAGQKAPVPNRPTVKEAISETITKGGPDSRASLYHKVTDKYGYWSRQSFYNAIKDKKAFKEIDGKVHNVQASPAKTTDAEAAKFVEKVAGDASVSSAT